MKKGIWPSLPNYAGEMPYLKKLMKYSYKNGLNYFFCFVSILPHMSQRFTYLLHDSCDHFLQKTHWVQSSFLFVLLYSSLHPTQHSSSVSLSLVFWRIISSSSLLELSDALWITWGISPDHHRGISPKTMGEMPNWPVLINHIK